MGIPIYLENNELGENAFYEIWIFLTRHEKGAEKTHAV